MHETTASAPALTWSRTFPATPDQAGEARRYLMAILGGHPATADAVTCLSELVTNSINHSRSAGPGGTFTVRMRRSGPAIRVEVTDDGGPWRDRSDDPEHGRGLLIVGVLSARQGIAAKGPDHNPHERTVWFEVGPLLGPGGPAEAADRDQRSDGTPCEQDTKVLPVDPGVPGERAEQGLVEGPHRQGT